MPQKNKPNVKSNLIQILLYMGGIFAFLSGIFLFFFIPSCIVNINLDPYYCLKQQIPSVIVFILLAALQIYGGIILEKQKLTMLDSIILLANLGLILAVTFLYWTKVHDGALGIIMLLTYFPIIFILIMGFCFILSLLLHKKLKNSMLRNRFS